MLQLEFFFAQLTVVRIKMTSHVLNLLNLFIFCVCVGGERERERERGERERERERGDGSKLEIALGDWVRLLHVISFLPHFFIGVNS